MSAAQRWAERRTYHHADFDLDRMAAERRATVSVCLPARGCAATIEPIVQTLLGLRDAGLIDEVVVIDAASPDGTAERARGAGAIVHQEQELALGDGPVLGKGDAMWRALRVLEGELVCYLDADSERFDGHFVTGLLGPLLCEPEIQFVKAFYRRPFSDGEVSLPSGGGRVNHLVARPALALHYPELAGVRQPLAGEVAARRSLLESIPYTTGYGVETAMLLDVLSRCGLDAIAQVDLGVHLNSHQSLEALVPMAHTVLRVIAERLVADGRLDGLPDGGLLDLQTGEPQHVELVRRPPLASLAPAAAAAAAPAPPGSN